MKGFIDKIKALLHKVKRFYEGPFLRFVDKVKYRLTHNFILNTTFTHLVLFRFIRIKITNKRRESTVGYMFIMLWIIGFLIFALYPVFYTLYLTFFNVSLDGGDLNMTFVGIANYQAAFLRDTQFTGLLIEYTLQILLNVPVTIVFALIVALIINQNIRGRGAWRTIFFLPVIIASGPFMEVLVRQGVTTLPSISEFTVIDLIIDNVGNVLANPIQLLFEQILFILWFSGIQILIFLAGLQKIDKSVYEAAMIDGAGPWESFWKITLPSIMPLITITIIYTVVTMSVFSITSETGDFTNFNEVIEYIRGVLFGPPRPSLMTGFGYGSALAWIFFLVMSLIILFFVGITSIRRKVR